MATFTYPEDRTGTAGSNFIRSEIHTVTYDNAADYHFVVPTFAPFFAESVRVYRVNNGARTLLEKGKDYYFGLNFVGASLSTAKPVHGGIVFMRVSSDIEFDIDYQTLGGQWTLDTASMLEAITNIVKNPAAVSWEQMTNLPQMFNPTDHPWDFENLRGPDAIVDALDRIALAIRDKVSTGSSVSTVTKESLGLGRVLNQGNSTMLQAMDPTNATSNITPQMLHYVLDQLGLLDLGNLASQMRAHLEDTNNPHHLNPSSVELGEVINLPLVSTEEVLNNASVKKYVTFDQVIRYVKLHGCGTQSTTGDTPPLGALMGTRCNDLTHDKVGLYANGTGGTYESIMEVKSVDCGYQSTVPVSHPPSGTILSEYCSNGALINLVADGYGGVTPRVAEAQSARCGTNSFPAAGTILDQKCNGSTKITTIATGNGGTRVESVENSSDCKVVTYPPQGTLKNHYCKTGTHDLVGVYHDGTGGTYDAIMERNSVDCGYVAPTQSPAPSYPVRGTPLGTTCEGTVKLNKFADGNGGFYTEVAQMNSPDCGFVTPTPTPGPTATPKPIDPNRKGTLTLKTSNPTIYRNTKEVLTFTLTGWAPNRSYSITMMTRSPALIPLIGKDTTSEQLEYNVITDSNGNGVANRLAGNPDGAAPIGEYATWFVVDGVSSPAINRRIAE